jgi:hypothetical protein
VGASEVEEAELFVVHAKALDRIRIHNHDGTMARRLDDDTGTGVHGRISIQGLPSSRLAVKTS